LAKKKYFTINSIHSVYKACQILSTFTNQCHCVHLHCHSKLDIHHFLKPFTLTPGEMCCCAILIHMYLMWSVLSSWLFIWFLICGFVQVLFLSCVVDF
jgi:hypothetical protein